MSGGRKHQASLNAFFKPVQPSSKPAAPVSSRPSPSTTVNGTPSNVPRPAFSHSSNTVNGSASEAVNPTASQPAKPAHDQGGYNSSLLSPSPNNDPSEGPPSLSQQLIQPPAVSSSFSSGRIIRSSDDEDSDSDSSLVDLTTLLQSHRSNIPPKPSTNKDTPSTPSASRFTSRNLDYKTSPIVVPKYKFDLKYLADLARTDDAAEASSKRVKALSALEDENSTLLPTGANSNETKTSHLDLLGSVVKDREEGEVQRVTRAIKRTEATLSEHRWYFFDTEAKPSKPKRSPFPTEFVTDDWKKDLSDPQVRYQTFISGFAEDMASFGKTLPDEIFLWMLDELCREPSAPLRSSYSNTLRESSEQVHRLIVPDVVQKLFKDLGGSPAAISVSQKIQSISGVRDPYGRRQWDELRSVIGFLGDIASSLRQEVRVYIICLLLRMCVDGVVFENVDLFDGVRETISRLCRHIPEESWEACCQEICTSLFNCVEEPTLRLQVVESVPSFPPRMHDLRRRLAMSFYFNDISYCTKHSHLLMDLDLFIKRLEDPTFDLTPQTDYRELAALISLLDIAIDDARSAELDLTDVNEERRFDKDIDDLAASIRDIMKSIGNPGAAFISRIEAKEVLELVAQRIADTLRSKPKPKQTVFDGPRGRAEEDLERERAGIQSFLSRMKSTAGKV